MRPSGGGGRIDRPGWVWLGAAVAMMAFAANSLLNRFAVGAELIDPATFTALRLVAGALMLWALVALRRRPGPPLDLRRNGLAAGLLFVYAAAFSFAYIRLGAGTGALLLFGAVQVVMYGAAILRGERPGAVGWVALALASSGVVTLVAPGATAPDAASAALMLAAGFSWGLYTLLGRGAPDPLLGTARNFWLSVPLALVLEAAILIGGADQHATIRGVALAIASGAGASALGYALWYSVLRRITGIQAGIVQLAPAPLAIVGGLVLLGEPLTVRVVAASVLVLVGVTLGLAAGRRRDSSAEVDQRESAQ